MSKKSSAALAEAIPAARASATARAGRAKVESTRPAKNVVVEEESSPSVDDEGEDEAAPASAVAGEAELVVLEEEFEFEDAPAEAEEGDVVAPAAK
jgi:hypothetical protein